MEIKSLSAKSGEVLKKIERGLIKTCNRLPFKLGYDFLFGTLLFAILFVFWLPTVGLPYWWDSIYLTQSAFDFLENGFWPLVSNYGDFAHPPFLMALFALIWKIFGESLLVSHLVILVFTFAALLYTYLLGKELAKGEALGRWVGFFSAFLLLVSPVFLAQVGIVYFEIPVTTFCLMALYYFLRDKKIGYVISATLMVWTKEVSGVVIGLILTVVLFEKLIEYLRNKKLDWKETAKETGIILSPFVFLFLWFVYHKMVKGWWMIVPGREFGGEAGLSLGNVPRVLKFVFLAQSRAILTVIMVIITAGVFYREDYRDYFKGRIVLLVYLIPIVVAVFFGITEFLHRYILFGLPFFFLAGVYFSSKVLEKIPGLKELEPVFRTSLLGFLVFFLFCLSYVSWDQHRRINNWHFTPLEENLEYRDVIKAGQDMVRYIEREYADKTIWTSFPASYMLSDPRQHFAVKDIEVRNCETYKPGDRVEIVVFHVFSPRSSECLALIRGLDMSLLTPFARSGKWMQVFKNPHLEQDSL